MAKTDVPRNIPPFTAAMAVHHLQKAMDELVTASIGYVPSERNNLMESITRLAIIARRPGAKTEEANKELEKCLAKYEQQYYWIHNL